MYEVEIVVNLNDDIIIQSCLLNNFDKQTKYFRIESSDILELTQRGTKIFNWFKENSINYKFYLRDDETVYCGERVVWYNKFVFDNKDNAVKFKLMFGGK